MWFLHAPGSGVWINVGRTLDLPGARQLEAEGNRAAQKVVVLFSCTIGRSAKASTHTGSPARVCTPRDPSGPHRSPFVGAPHSRHTIFRLNPSTYMF